MFKGSEESARDQGFDDALKDSYLFIWLVWPHKLKVLVDGRSVGRTTRFT
ncbi:unnamed protein product [Linum tenue]|uniref:Uncharacterized protein n=1 Tax=Linum tenue TaxID=586396 RepID=A0AAV0NKP7_9ROSI|nr:unnamed protein product [Linum tenue]